MNTDENEPFAGINPTEGVTKHIYLSSASVVFLARGGDYIQGAIMVHGAPEHECHCATVDYVHERGMVGCEMFNHHCIRCHGMEACTMEACRFPRGPSSRPMFQTEHEVDVKKPLSEAERLLAKLRTVGSDSYIERVLELPMKTLRRWEKEATSEDMALLRMLAAFPWLVGVADDRFEKKAASAAVIVAALQQGAPAPEPLNSLTLDEVTKACDNIGYNLRCGACAEIFYTGVTTAMHDEKYHQIPKNVEASTPKKYECDRCKDTGLYDACCRPHRCTCAAGENIP